MAALGAADVATVGDDVGGNGGEGNAGAGEAVRLVVVAAVGWRTVAGACKRVIAIGAASTKASANQTKPRTASVSKTWTRRLGLSLIVWLATSVMHPLRWRATVTQTSRRHAIVAERANSAQPLSRT